MRQFHKNKNDLAGEHPWGDFGQFVFFVLFLLIWVLDSFVFKFSIQLSGAIPLYLRLPPVALLLILAGYLAKSGHMVFREGPERPHVVKTGAFAHVRHPMYLAGILFYISLGISSLSLIAIAFLPAIFIFYNFIAGYEEMLLERKFGREYLGYKKSVPRWIPKPAGGAGSRDRAGQP